MADPSELRPARQLGVGAEAVGSFALTATVAALTFLLAYDNGSYSLQSRNTLAIAVWWSVGLALVLRIRRSPAITAGALVTIGVFTLFTAWTGLSAAWSRDTEAVVAELDRASLYLGLAVLAIFAVTRWSLPRILDGIGLGVTAVAALALTSRFLPGIASVPDEVPRHLPAAATRLSYPVGYWNGLGILVAIGVPALLRTAIAGRTPAGRCLAVGALPLLGTTIDLTSSRGAAAVSVVGAVVFVAAASRRWAAAAAILAGTAGSLLSVAGVHAAAQEGAPVGSDQASAALIVAGGCVVGSGLYLVWDRVAYPRWHPAAAVGWVATALVVLLGLGVIGASHPVRRLHDFKLPASARESADPNYVRTSFSEGSGSGRWQYWTAAVNQFRAAPLVGGGAGSYEAWWLRHGSLPRQVLDAHSLYLETLGELGIVGFLLLVGAFVAPLATALRRLARAGERTALAAALAVFAAYGLGAGIDWMWELTIVSLIGLVCLGLLVSPATAPGDGKTSMPGHQRTPLQVALATTLAVVAIAAIVVAGIPLLAQVELERSRAAARRGDTSGAISHARTARKIEPWAASPYLQLALANEQAGDYTAARAWLKRAIGRDREDWRLWLVSARLETEAGRVAAARTSLARARELNPRSAIFSGS